LSYTAGPSFTAAYIASLSTTSFPSIPACALTLWHTVFFWWTRRYKSIYNLKSIQSKCWYTVPKMLFFFSFKTIYDMSCHLLTES
jgi:hypothetical protein